MPADSRPAAAALSDPISLGEDHDRNIRLALDEAPVRCGTCLNYHMLFPIYRSVGRVSTIFRDRIELVRLIGTRIAEGQAVGGERIDVVVLGSADTQILATCAHAALVNADIAQVRFTVLDLCGTPLALCRDYAARHNLTISTREVDVTQTEDIFPADLIVLHSLLNHLPPQTHVPLLQRVGSWLKPDGRVVFSTSVKSALSRARNRERRDQADDLVMQSVRSGELQIAEPVEVFAARLRARPRQVTGFASADAVRNLLEMSGLRLCAFDEIRGPSRLPSGLSFERVRVLAVLGPGP